MYSICLSYLKGYHEWNAIFQTNMKQWLWCQKGKYTRISKCSFKKLKSQLLTHKLKLLNEHKLTTLDTYINLSQRHDKVRQYTLQHWITSEYTRAWWLHIR